MGYALTQCSTTTPMTPSEKSFLRDYFNEGQRTKQKMSGAAGADLALEKLRNDPSFSPPYPKRRQIQTFFTDCYRKLKNQTISNDGIALVPNDANLDGEAQSSSDLDRKIKIMILRSLFDLILDHFFRYISIMILIWS